MGDHQQFAARGVVEVQVWWRVDEALRHHEERPVGAGGWAWPKPTVGGTCQSSTSGPRSGDEGRAGNCGLKFLGRFRALRCDGRASTFEVNATGE